MKYPVLLCVVALLPIAAVLGYFAHSEPSLPGFGDYAVKQLGVRHVPGQDSDDWLAAVVSGPAKGATAAASDVIQFFPNQKSVEESAGGKVKYYEVRCQNYSSGGDKALMFISRSVIRKCSAALKTRKQVESHVQEQIQG